MRLTEQEIASRLETLDWQREGDSIVREWTLADFAAAIAFVDRIAELAEAANHHPDLLVHRYRRVRVTLTTHVANGLTAHDFDLARRIDALG